MDNVLINLKNINFGYSTCSELLNDLNFTLRRGDKVGITGPNGCGKTTFLYIIMGLLKPLCGEVKILGKKRNNEQDFKEVREKIGFLFQDSDNQLFCPTVEEEIAFGPLNFGKSSEEVKIIVRKVLSLIGLEGFEKKAPYNLSGGEKRKLALATVLAMNPKILLLDEPTSELDESGIEKLINVLNVQDLSYIIVSQDKKFLKATDSVIHVFSSYNQFITAQG